MSIRSCIEQMDKEKAVRYLTRTRKEFRDTLAHHGEITCAEDEQSFLRDLDMVIEWLQDFYDLR